MSKRGPAHVWKRFWSLKSGESFYVSRTEIAIKGDWFWFHYGNPGGSVWFLTPWRKVRTTVLRYPNARVNCGCPSGPDGTLGPPGDDTAVLIPTPSYFDKANRAENTGQTHFLGDDCPGGHYNKSTPEARGTSSEYQPVIKNELGFTDEDKK